MDLTSDRRSRKRQQTADLLADTAFRLFEAEGYEEVTMERIAAEADVAKGTLYNHFPVKEALLRHYFHRQLAGGVEAMTAELVRIADPVKRIAAFLRYAAAWAERHRKYLPHYPRYRLGQPLTDYDKIERSGMDLIFRKLIESAQEAGRIRRDRDAASLTHYLQYFYLGAVTRWLLMPGIDLVKEFEAMLDLFISGAKEQT
jgi:AcrR family transcriptional regulator